MLPAMATDLLMRNKRQSRYQSLSAFGRNTKMGVDTRHTPNRYAAHPPCIFEGFCRYFFFLVMPIEFKVSYEWIIIVIIKETLYIKNYMSKQSQKATLIPPLFWYFTFSQSHFVKVLDSYFASYWVLVGSKGHLFAVCPVDRQPLQSSLLCPYVIHLLQWRSRNCPCSNWLKIRPLVAVLCLRFARSWARFSASRSRRNCRAIGSSIRGGGGWNSWPGGGRFKCQWGWKSEGTIPMKS